MWLGNLEFPGVTKRSKEDKGNINRTDTKTHKQKPGRELITTEQKQSAIAYLFQNVLQPH